MNLERRARNQWALFFWAVPKVVQDGVDHVLHGIGFSSVGVGVGVGVGVDVAVF